MRNHPASFLLRRAAIAAVLVASIVACSPETLQTTVGEGGFRLRSTTVQIGDTLTIDAGVWFNDGSFVRDTFARYSVSPPGVAQIGNISGILTGNGSGVATVSATLRGQVTIDTTVLVEP
jgi:hypothetical protein